MNALKGCWVADSQQMEACLQMVNVSQAAESLSSDSIQSTPFFVFLENFNCCHMKHEVETDRHSNPQDTLDAGSTHEGGGLLPSGRASGARSERFEGFESSKGCQSEQEGGQAGTNNPLEPLEPLASPGCDQREQPLELDKLEERFRKECRKSCRRNFWIELFKSAAKIAGVVLAALGLSSFNEEN